MNATRCSCCGLPARVTAIHADDGTKLVTEACQGCGHGQTQSTRPSYCVSRAECAGDILTPFGLSCQPCASLSAERIVS